MEEVKEKYYWELTDALQNFLFAVLYVKHNKDWDKACIEFNEKNLEYLDEENDIIFDRIIEKVMKC